jgi:aminoglycoside/choline kinase family phosphotransferase
MSDTANSSRNALLQHWVAERSARFGVQPETLAPASSDASFRRYFRVRVAAATGVSSLIVMDAPPEQMDIAPFLHAREIFAGANVRVPAIQDADHEHGFMLLEDFGDTQYLGALTNESAPKLYGAALDALVAIQCQSVAGSFPSFDAAFLLRELDLFRDWYCTKHMGFALSSEHNAALDKIFALLVARAAAQPQVHVHRDYHSRNLMVLDDMSRGPGILDFQDALIGPITYDLVSLLRDAYIVWDEEQVLDWAVRYWERARKAGLPVDAQFGEFYRDFECMGLQRHLKILGIFARLKHRDAKDGYLKDMPLVNEYVRKCAARYNGFGPLLRLLDAVEGQQARVGYTF